MSNASKEDIQKEKERILQEWTSDNREKKTIISFALLTIFFTVFGIALAVLTSKIQMVEVRYDSFCGTPAQRAVCNMSVTFSETLPSPVYIYYELDNFYQNHRTYLNSKDLPQLKGEVRSIDELTSCDPVKSVGDLYPFQRYDLNGNPLSPWLPANPCGLIAKSMFNDTYNFTNPQGVQIPINEKNIAWVTDVQNVYKQPPNYKTIQWTDVTNEHFMVWMRPAGLPNFRKLWGRIEQDITPGTYTLTIVNNYDATVFSGQKSLIFQTVNAFGGKNILLTVCYFIAAGVSLIVFLYFCVRVVRKRKQL
mmetsp:Transcript_69521/g.81165  ORF Transcript_69521/g.81165 Transcript_69521/m.81165 type:complete len:307 (+) Transcript_69521:45-965(+)